MSPSFERRSRILLVAAPTLALALAAWAWQTTRSGVAELRQSTDASARRAAELETQVAGLERELVGTREELAERNERAAQALAQRLEQSNATLARIASELAAQSQTLAGVSAVQAAFEADRLPTRVDELGLAVQEGRTALAQAIDEVTAAERDARSRLEDVARRLGSSSTRASLWQELVGPVVQLEGPESVGSAVLLPQRAREDGRYEAFVLTAWHVVRDIQGDLEHTDVAVPTRLFGPNGEERLESSKLLRFDAALDVALLLLESDQPLPHGAALAPRERLSHLSVFDPVYAVGCPLGSEPVPTEGAISDADHEIDGQHYFMVNAPTFIGNSGGGVFDAESRTLIGIFSKIYNYGTGRPSVVPHMGLATPLGRVYDWLDTVGYASLSGDAPSAVALEASVAVSAR